LFVSSHFDFDEHTTFIAFTNNASIFDEHSSTYG